MPFLHDEAPVGKRLATNDATEYEAEEVALAPATFEAVAELVEIALQGLRTDTAEGTAEPGLDVDEGSVHERSKKEFSTTRVA